VKGVFKCNVLREAVFTHGRTSKAVAAAAIY